MRFLHFCINLAQIIIHRGFVKLSLMLMFAETDEICKQAPKVPGSRHLASNPTLTASAFLDANRSGCRVMSGYETGKLSLTANLEFGTPSVEYARSADSKGLDVPLG